MKMMRSVIAIPSALKAPSGWAIDGAAHRVSSDDARAGGLGELLDHHLPLQPRNMVDEQDAVEVIDLVLQAGRQQAIRLDCLLLSVAPDVLDGHGGGALDL